MNEQRRQWKKKKETRQKQHAEQAQHNLIYAGASSAAQLASTLGVSVSASITSSTFGLFSSGVQALRHVGTSSLGGLNELVRMQTQCTKQQTQQATQAATATAAAVAPVAPVAPATPKQQERFDDLF
jgi:hypothetical protein